MTTQPVAIVTASSRGIGAACARQLSADGYHVAVMSRTKHVHAIAKEIDGLAHRGDLRNPRDISSFMNTIKNRWGRIDVLVNNAGDASTGDPLTLGDDAWGGAFDLLFMSVLRVSREAVPLIRAAGGGVIVNISAADGLEPTLQFPTSGPMRAAVSALTKLLARRLAPDRIRVNSVLPWVVLDADRQWQSEEIPLLRAATHEEIARVVSFLCSDAGSYVTGVNLPVDGGWSKSL